MSATIVAAWTGLASRLRTPTPSDLPLGLRRGPTLAVHGQCAAREARRGGRCRSTCPSPTWPTGAVASQVRGRDMRTGADGTTQVVDASDSSLEFDLATGGIEHVDSSESGLDALLGTSIRKAFSRTLAQAFPTASAERSLGFSLLEEASGAVFVAGFALLRAGFIPEDPASGPEQRGAPGRRLRGLGGGYAAAADPPHRGTHGGPDGTRRAAGRGGRRRRLARRCRRSSTARSGVGGASTSPRLRWRVHGGRPHAANSYADVDVEMVLHEYLVEVAVD